MSPRRVVSLVALLSLGACLGARQLLAETVMVATVLATPDVLIADEAFTPDGGSSDGGVTVDGQTIVFVFLGEREEGALDTPPAGVEGAALSVRAGSGAAVPLRDEGDGRYRLSSAEDGRLDYAAGQTYELRATVEEEVFTAEVQNVPPAEEIPELHPPLGFTLLDAGAGMTLTRPPGPAGEERPLGFVTVFELQPNGGLGGVTWTNIPDAPLEVLQLVARPANWRRTEIALPGEAFPNGGSNYLVTFQAAKLGRPTSANLFVGSAILAGIADVGVVRTR